MRSSALHELTEMPRHRRLIVRDQNAAVACGERKYFVIAQSREAGG
jgi:hypothetical protein